MSDITIRLLTSVDEMQAAVELQKVYWGENMSALVPNHMLLSIANYGGHIHGAFDGDTMVGMLLGFLGADIDPDSDDTAPQRMLIMSKRMVVLPDYRGQKIGERLKLVQRDYAMRHGIELVTWTFDPLLSRNAYLNLHKLAGTGQAYKAAYFGESANYPTLSGDRLVVNWWVNHPQTVSDLNFQRPSHPNTDHLDFVSYNRTLRNDDGFVVPDTLNTGAIQHPRIGFEIPSDFLKLEAQHEKLGQQWRDHVRENMEKLFASGYIATDFTVIQPAPDSNQRHSYYIFTKDDNSYQFKALQKDAN